jgi:hypothetical protein
MTYFIFVNNNLQTKPVVHRLLPTYLQFAIIYQVSNLKIFTYIVNAIYILFRTKAPRTKVPQT